MWLGCLTMRETYLCCPYLTCLDLLLERTHVHVLAQARGPEGSVGVGAVESVCGVCGVCVCVGSVTVTRGI